MTDETGAVDPPAAPPCPSICAAPSTMPPSGSAAVRGPAQRGRHEGGSGSPDPSPASAGPRARRRPPPPRRTTIPLPRESRTQYLESMTGAQNARWGELPGENSPCRGPVGTCPARARCTASRRCSSSPRTRTLPEYRACTCTCTRTRTMVENWRRAYHYADIGIGVRPAPVPVHAHPGRPPHADPSTPLPTPCHPPHPVVVHLRSSCSR